MLSEWSSEEEIQKSEYDRYLKLNRRCRVISMIFVLGVGTIVLIPWKMPDSYLQGLWDTWSYMGSLICSIGAVITSGLAWAFYRKARRVGPFDYHEEDDDQEEN